MLDTKLKKTRRFSWVAIFLSIFLPAVLLVALYPMMSDIAAKKILEFEAEQENEPENEYWIQSNFINYAVESSYYLYGKMLQEATGENVDFSVLEYYGWINDYYYFTENNHYYVQFGSGENAIVKANAKNYSAFLDLSKQEEASRLYEEEGMIAYLILEYDKYGDVSRVDCWNKYPLDTGNSAYAEVNESIEKYRRNVRYWNESVNGNTMYEEEAVNNTSSETAEREKYQIKPKDFQCVFVLYEDTPFVYEDGHMIGYRPYEDLYLEMGAIWIVIILAVLVAILALLLPFIKPIGTGWEKLFCMPFECVVVVGVGAVGGFVLMFLAMCHTNINFLTDNFFSNDTVEFMGGNIGVETLFGILMALSVIGWALCFLLEYIVFASFRQFCCSPKTYIKERLIGVMIFRWLWRKCRGWYEEITHIDINEKLHKSIIKIVLGNLLAVALLCLLWMFVIEFFYASEFEKFIWGVICLLLYSIGLYVFLRKYGQKIQNQYKSVIDATHQMAQGNLKITLHEDLGIFAPLGTELQKVQQGFSKAVVEEAKSQNMKTELITNISHDLKTPLTAIITYVDLLKQENITEEERKSYIQTIDQKSNRLKSLIEDLFEVSKVNSGNIKLNLQQVDVVNLLKQIRFEMEEDIQKSNLTFRWNLPEEKVVLNLDSQRTYRIFENLLTNMLKYAMPYTRAYVDALVLDKKVIIVFRNVSAAELNFDVQKLSERFVRGDASRNTEGHGLGLAIVKSFVEIQKGTFKIDVDGDLFKVTITWDME